MRILGLGVAALCATPVSAAQSGVPDCPLRSQAFGLESPFLDIVLSPSAAEVVKREAPELLQIPLAKVEDPKAAGFAAIVSTRMAARFFGGDPAGLDRLGAALAATPVTMADQVARCARYDEDEVRLPARGSRRRLLLFEKITGFRDQPSVDAAHAALLSIADHEGWDVVVSDKGGVMTPQILAQMDVVIWNNVSGDVLTVAQRAAFRAYVEGGGGYVGIHGSGGDPIYFWPWYADDLLGARFVGHPDAPQFQAATIRMEEAGPLSTGLPRSWEMIDEWYSFRQSPRATGSLVVATLDEGSYSPRQRGESLAMGDHPIAWARCPGLGRAFYSAIGHRPESYSDPNHRRLLTQALRWAKTPRREACENSLTDGG